MNTRRKKPTDKEIVLNLFDLMFEAELESEEDSDNFIREQGLDLDALVNEGKLIIGNYKRELRLSRGRKKKTLFDSLMDRLKSLSSLADRRKAIIETMKPCDPELALVFNRRLEKITDADLESLENENKLLELWSDFCVKDQEEA